MKTEMLLNNEAALWREIDQKIAPVLDTPEPCCSILLQREVARVQKFF
jgi:hypothetical protein